jgi:glycosyltransferase involved in cell wall biosynthesis
VIGMVGRLDPMKDHSNFLRAAALLSRDRIDLRFVCVGGGPRDYSDRLERLGIELGLEKRLIWEGTRSDISEVYNAFDLATSSSSGEGFPNVVAEAMACGIPCVVTDVGDSAAIVGMLGIVVPPADPERLARAWDMALRQIEPTTALQTRQRIIDEFSLVSLVSRSEQVLQQLTS